MGFLSERKKEAEDELRKENEDELRKLQIQGEAMELNGLRKQKGQNRIRTGRNFAGETFTVNENEPSSFQSSARYQNRICLFTL